MRATALCVAICCAALLSQPATARLRLGSVMPTSYHKNDPVEIKVNSLTSYTRLMPMEWYSMPWCSMDEKIRKKYKENQNLGEVLWGSRIEPSLFEASVLKSDTCHRLCEPTKISAKDRELLKKRIDDNYRGNLVLDNLPAAEEGTGNRGPINSAVAVGFALGVPKKLSPTGKTIVHNHLALTIQYHIPTTLAAVDEDSVDVYRIVGFQVAAMSIDHKKSPCSDKMDVNTAVATPVDTDSEEIEWTYSVKWEDSDIEWSTRWDAYIKSTKVESRIHWISILNSLLVVVLLSAIIALILIRALRKDFARYNDPESIEEEREETGWKLVHGDVFRKPAGAGLLAMYVGSGAQLLFMSAATIILACIGFVRPGQRGQLMTIGLFLFAILGTFSGFTTAVIAKMFKMKSWKLIIGAGVFFPGQIFGIYFLLNLVHWWSKAASATPFLTVLTLMALWFCVSVPLALVGGAIGYRRDSIEFPTKTASIARSIPPQPWYMQMPQSVILPGILPFGAAFIESVFILSSIWQGRMYYVFGFLGLVFLILCITVAEATIVMIYCQLVNLDYRWWWRSFLTGASYGLWLFLYSVVYFATALQIKSLSSAMLYFGYMFIGAYFCAMITGTVGFIAAFLFVRTIYGSVKVD